MEGKILGPYRIDERIGSGGMGTVYRAEVVAESRGTEVGETVALKVVHPHLLATPGFFKRFLREAEIGERVRHGNVVRTIDADALLVDDAQVHFLVMEYVSGQTLRQLLEDLSHVPEELCRHIGREVAAALDAIHAAGVVHRDLKPENVLITPEHAVKVMDLGVARLTDEVIRLSLTGAFVGSIHYAAPEQISGGGEDLDGRADLHALGVLLYELASGRHPFDGDDFRGVLNRVLTEKPPRLTERNTALSPFFAELVETLLAKDREERFASARALLDVLTAGEDSQWWTDRAREVRARSDPSFRRIRLPRETAVFGREAELDRLVDLFRKAAAGEGRAVLVEGEAGIGKTRLVDELAHRVREEGEPIHFLFGAYPPSGAATAAGAFSSAYREHFGEEGLAETLAGVLRTTPLLVPSFAALLAGDATPKDAEPLTKDSLQTVFVHATRAIAAERPVIILIDDLHNAPEEGLSLFAALSLAIPADRVLLIGTTRPGPAGEWRAGLERLPHFVHMVLERLGPKDLTHLLVEAFRSERLAEELAFRIAAKSDGNPFFIFEIIRGLREGRLIERGEDGAWASTQAIGEILIPSSVVELTLARISDLGEEEHELLDIAACAGFEFDPGLVADAIGQPRIPVLRTLGRIERTHRLVRSVGRRFLFDHPQVHEALYQGLSGMLREEYHAALGETLAAQGEPTSAQLVTVCEHFLKGGRGPAALPYLKGALDHLEQGYLNDAALDLSWRALEQPGLLEGEDRLEILERRIRILSLLGRSAEEKEAIDEAEPLAVEPEWRGRIALHRTKWLLRAGRLDEAEEALTRAVADEPSEETARALRSRLANVLLRKGRVREAGEIYEEILAASIEAGDPAQEAMARGNVGLISHHEGRIEDAVVMQERSLELAEKHGTRDQFALALFNLATTLHRLRRTDEARLRYERALEIARETGNRRSEAVRAGNLGVLLMETGDLPGARDSLERSARLSREVGYRNDEAWAESGLAMVEFAAGRPTAGFTRSDHAAGLFREFGDRRGEAIVTGNRGAVLVNLGRGEEAIEALTRAEETFEELGDRAGWLQFRTTHAHALAETGRLSEAAEMGREVIAELADRGLGPELGVARAVLGGILLKSGDEEGAAEELTAAATLGEEHDGHAEHALSLLRLAKLGRVETAKAVRVYESLMDRLDFHQRLRGERLIGELTDDDSRLAKAREMEEEYRGG
jgi:tetratricopeptide (TPR) repeat protein